MIRGGSWNNRPARLRSANRNRNAPDNRNTNVGFRLASPPASSPEPVRPGMRRVWHAGVHKPASRTPRDGRAK
ncbi:MAG: SUMF1/EgtB/PvdO family nonheme iron enzyme [Candidatus Competibacteraceae bacterium]|nr:SUMF1/EgtB/PvdO family nonheme iron enzyme [Candidatus Competibacteraceae bacterium]